MQLSRSAQSPTTRIGERRGEFFKGTQLQHQQSCQTVQRQRPETFTVKNFKFMKKLGLKKPDFLPDFGLDKRKALLATLYTNFDPTTLSPVLADDLKLSGGGKNVKSKQDYITLLEQLKAAVPDFSWSHDTDGAKDEAGFATVTFTGKGKFDGQAFSPPKTPPIEPSGKPVDVKEQSARIMVEDGVAKEIQFSETSGGFLDQIYAALGGKIPLAK